jgi:hypothetical protein
VLLQGLAHGQLAVQAEDLSRPFEQCCFHGGQQPCVGSRQSLTEGKPSGKQLSGHKRIMASQVLLDGHQANIQVLIRTPVTAVHSA